MVIRVHNHHPDFKTREIVQILDEKPVLSKELLKLTDWVHRFYYSGPGEAIQAALPAGLNFVAEPHAKINNHKNDPPSHGLEREVYLYLEEHEGDAGLSSSEISKRWKDKGAQALDRLTKKGLVEIWQIPRIRMKPKTETVWDWSNDIPFIPVRNQKEVDCNDISSFTDNLAGNGKKSKTPKWIHGLSILYQLPLPATRRQILDHPEITPYVWKRIQDSGYLVAQEVPVGAIRRGLPYDPEAISRLNPEQEEVYQPVREAILSQKFKRFLLFGVTGSGKTEIYIHALRETLNQGRNGLVLVPEIALTPQTVRRFHLVFGNQIAVLHSRLSERERYDAWTSLQKGEKKIAIGARSAVFAPVQNPGLIIIDEEHDASYKQEDPAPRYHARETAIMRAYYNNAVVLTGSATPSMISLHAAGNGKCTMLQIENRHALAKLPEVKIIDLRKYRHAMRGPLSIPLFQAIEDALGKKEQVILLHNRRGYATFLQCEDCGSVVECPNCSVSLTYHKANKHLRCHYCGYSRLPPRRCSLCNSTSVGELGMGTQKVESELETCFPTARIVRMDQDSTGARNAHEKILQQFARGETDILMGTQLVAKGLDFPNVTVVGVINSDTELAFPSYRSSERMYQLLSQVAGRSGRGKKPGIVFLQTLMPEHSALQFAQKHDFQGFARHEMKSRRTLDFPPYSRLTKIIFKSADPELVAVIATLFTEIICRFIPDKQVMGPSPSTIVRMKRVFSWESHIKLPPEKSSTYIERLFEAITDQYNKEKPKSAGKVRITINMDTMY